MAYRELDIATESTSHMLQAAECAHALGWASRRNYLLRYLVADATRGPSKWAVDEPFLTSAERWVGEGECLVAYVCVQKKLVAVVVEHGRTRFVPLGKVDRIDELCADLSRTRGLAGADATHTLLIAPLALDAAVQRIVVVPGEKLAGVPLSAVEPNRQIVYAPASYPMCVPDPRGASGVLRVVGVNGDRRAATPEEAETVDLAGPHSIDAFRKQLAKKWRCIHFDCPYDWTTDSLGSVKVGRLIALEPQADLLVFASSYSARMRLETSYGLLDGFEEALASPSIDLQRLKEAMDLVERRRKGQIAPLYVLDRTRPQVLVSLWEVDEEAGRVLLGRFYELWTAPERVGAGEALFGAQAYMRSQQRWAEPRYWAGWQLWGNARGDRD